MNAPTRSAAGPGRRPPPARRARPRSCARCRPCCRRATCFISKVTWCRTNATVPHRVPRTSARRGAAGDRGRGRRGAALLPQVGRAGRRARRRDRLSGGALPHRLGVTLSLARLNRIVSLDLVSDARRSCRRRAQPRDQRGRPRPTACCPAPDLSSQIACSIGGNVAENSGGVHCLKYGLIAQNVLRVGASRSKASRSCSAARALDTPGST